MRTRSLALLSMLVSVAPACGSGTSTSTAERTGTAASAIYHGDVADPAGSGIAEISTTRPAGVATCTGTMITNEWVLTAAHCVVGVDKVTKLPPAAFTVRPHGLATPPVSVSAVEKHPSIDAALLRLTAPATINGLTYGFARPLYNQVTTTLDSKVLRCYGYGGHDVTGSIDDRLRVGDLPVTDTTFSILHPDATAAGAEITMESTAMITQKGDSGGPCFVRASDGFDLLATVHQSVGAGDGGALPPYHAHDVSVSTIASWIAENAFGAHLFAPAVNAAGNVIAVPALGDAPDIWATNATTADVNGDGCDDWVYAGTDTVSWKTSACNGSFASKEGSSHGSSGWLASRTRFANVDNVGGDDFLYVSDLGVSVRLGTVDAGPHLADFASPPRFTPFVSTTGAFAALGDVDGDGKIDVVVPRNNGLDTLIGLGTGYFSAPVPTEFGSSGWLGGTTFASVHDGKGFDWVYVNDPGAAAKGTSVRASLVFPLLPRGTFTSSGYGDEVRRSARGTFLLADVNGDKRADFIDIEPTDVYVYVGLPVPTGPTGSYFATTPMRTHFELGSTWADLPKLLSAADVNGDGCADLVYRGGSRIWVKPANCLAGVGNGTFGALVTDYLEPLVDEATGPEWGRTRMARIDGGKRIDDDKRADLVNLGARRVNAKLSIMPPPALPFGPIKPPPLPGPTAAPLAPGATNSMSFADTDGNGTSDRVFLTKTGVMTLSDSGHRSFVDGWCTEPGAQVLVADFDGDHLADVLCRHGDGTNSIARGDGVELGSPGTHFSFCPAASQLFAGAFSTGPLVGLMCHDPVTGENRLKQPDGAHPLAAATEVSKPAWCGSPVTCVKESNKDLCWDGVDNNCDGVIDEGCPQRASIGRGQLVMGDFDADGHPDFACHETLTRSLYVSSWGSGYFGLSPAALPISGTFCDNPGDVLFAANVDGLLGDDLACRSATGGLRVSLTGSLPFKIVDFSNPDLAFCTVAGGKVQFGFFDGTRKSGMACVLPSLGIDFPAVLNDLLSHVPVCPPGSTTCG